MRWFVLFVLAMTLACCGKVPSRPDIALCTVDIPRSQLICAKIKAPQEVTIVELDQADKYIAFSPLHWSMLNTYVQKLKDLIIRKCKGVKRVESELNDFLDNLPRGI